jgi:hypothetical protein
MKSVIILVLAAALLAGLYLSKPTQADFATFMNGQTQPAQAQSLQGMGKQLLGNLMGSAQAATLTYHDHIFWASEDLDGKAQYVGLFSHWWKKGGTATPAGR